MASGPSADELTQPTDVHGKERLLLEYKQQKELLELIFRLDPSGLAVVAGPDLEFKLANPAFRQITPHPEIEPLGRRFAEIWPMDEGYSSGHVYLREIIQSGEAVYDQRFERQIPDGSRRYFAFHICPILWQNQDGALLVIHETSEVEEARRQAEQSRAEAERRALEMEAIIDGMDEALMVYDRDLIMRRANAAAIQSLGFDPTDEFRHVLMENFALYNEAGKKLSLDEMPSGRAWRGERVSGERLHMINIRGEQSTILASAYPVNVAGELSGLVVLWRDITDRVRAEQTLRESEEQFRQLAESMPQLVWTARVDGVVDYYNRRAGLFQGIKQVADEQWTWGPVLHPDDVQATVEAWTLAVETGSVYQMEHRLCMADGSYRWHLSRGLPVRDESGKIVRWYGTATDIHDRKMSEELLRAYNERLERSNRDLQEFAFVASHDLQEPLRKIEALGDALLQKSDNLPERQQDYLARIRRAAGRMRAMVDGLLTLSRLNMEAQHFEPVDLNVLVAEIVAELGPVLRKSDGRVVAKRLPEVNGDRRQLRQLFFNLISNAIKFQAEGATPSITISTRRSTPKWVEIRVEDNGIGFDPAYTENLFQPFRRLVSMTQFEGAGMGLAVSRRIVERHGGWIEADSIPGRGSIFTVTFPLQSES